MKKMGVITYIKYDQNECITNLKADVFNRITTLVEQIEIDVDCFSDINDCHLGQIVEYDDSLNKAQLISETNLAGLRKVRKVILSFRRRINDIITQRRCLKLQGADDLLIKTLQLDVQIEYLNNLLDITLKEVSFLQVSFSEPQSSRTKS